MKKILVLFALLAVTLTGVQAQSNLRWGVTGGLNVSHFSPDGFENKAGFHLGAKAELGFPDALDGLYMDFGLAHLEGLKVDGDEGEVKFTPYYLEIPVHVGYKFPVSSKCTLFANAGPYLSIGMFGKSKVEVKDETEKTDFFGNDGADRFDFGLGLKAGVELNQKYQISLGYDWGLIDIEDDLDSKNGNMMLSLTYFF